MSWKIKHKQDNIKKLIFKKYMQSSWNKSCDRDKPVENKLKIITKSILKKKLI